MSLYNQESYEIFYANDMIYGKSLVLFTWGSCHYVSVWPGGSWDWVDKVSPMSTPYLLNLTPNTNLEHRFQWVFLVDNNSYVWQNSVVRRINHSLCDSTGRGWLEVCAWSLLDSLLCTFCCIQNLLHTSGYRILTCVLLTLSFFIFLSALCTAGILVSQTGIEPVPPELKVWSLNHWTTNPLFYFNKPWL